MEADLRNAKANNEYDGTRKNTEEYKEIRRKVIDCEGIQWSKKGNKGTLSDTAKI